MIGAYFLRRQNLYIFIGLNLYRHSIANERPKTKGLHDGQGLVPES